MMTTKPSVFLVALLLAPVLFAEKQAAGVPPAQSNQTSPIAVTPASAANEQSKATAGNYRMQQGDVVDVRFFFHPELNEQGVQIRPDGCISLQLVGDVKLAGRTVEDVRRELETTYLKVLKTPRITLQIRSFSTLKAFVAGEVQRPGTISLSTPTTLIAAIGEAGGINTRGNRNHVIIIRKMPDGTPGRQNVELFRGGKPTVEAESTLQPFDVVLVPESSIARVDRWVDQYIRQLVPVNMNAGFLYLWQRDAVQSATGAVSPF